MISLPQHPFCVTKQPAGAWPDTGPSHMTQEQPAVTRKWKTLVTSTLP